MATKIEFRKTLHKWHERKYVTNFLVKNVFSFFKNNYKKSYDYKIFLNFSNMIQ